jgi:hypothetical protein
MCSTTGWWWRDIQTLRKRLAIRFLVVKSALYLTNNLPGRQLPPILWRWHVRLLSQQNNNNREWLIMSRMMFQHYFAVSSSQVLCKKKMTTYITSQWGQLGLQCDAEGEINVTLFLISFIEGQDFHTIIIRLTVFRHDWINNSLV